MIVRVENCFHWIGFHLVTYLMDQGMEIHGIDPVNTTKKEFFYSLVGRNDKFTLVSVKSREDVNDTTIKVIPSSIKQNQTDNVILIKKPQRADGYPQTCSLHVPNIIGKWMPREGVEGLINQTQPTNDLKTVIHLDELLTVIYQWIRRDSLLPHETQLMSQRNTFLSHRKVKNFVYLCKHQSIEDYVKDIIQHYYQFKDYY